MSKNAVIIYSGGMDSFTVLHKAIALGYTPFALSFNYGQKHKKELQYAKKVCERLRIDHKIVDISSINQLLGGSALIDDIAMPEGHYHEPSMKQTVVPNRNMILLSLAIAQAVSIDAKTVFYGAHSGDHAIYPDCRPEFVEKMNAVSQIANYEAVEILSPYLLQTKADILADGLSMGLDYEQTWTCYNGREHACGKCGACQERLEAFAINNTIDPLSYE